MDCAAAIALQFNTFYIRPHLPSNCSAQVKSLVVTLKFSWLRVSFGVFLIPLVGATFNFLDEEENQILRDEQSFRLGAIRLIAPPTLQLLVLVWNPSFPVSSFSLSGSHLSPVFSPGLFTSFSSSLTSWKFVLPFALSCLNEQFPARLLLDFLILIAHSSDIIFFLCVVLLCSLAKACPPP